MILFSRITCYIVIVQLFALSGIPAAEKLGFTGNHANFLSHFESASDQKVIPEHQDGDLNNELTFNLEEELEEKNHLSDFFNATISATNYFPFWISDIHDPDYGLFKIKGVSLFILFHCWKTDYLEA